MNGHEDGYESFFEQLTGHRAHAYQRELAEATDCRDRLIRVPTGLGKTEGVLSAWMWYQLERRDPSWPRRLIWCLPMRVLVQQTKRVAEDLSARWTTIRRHPPAVAPRVECLMGGIDAGDWHLEPERPAILIGTQDMLLSRALNRGYASGRARWPVEFGLLNHDSLWIMDEVQLMDVGLITSVQLQAFRRQDGDKSLRPCCTWWMSATLQEGWLETVDFHDALLALKQQVLEVHRQDRVGPLWEVRKHLSVLSIPARSANEFATWASLVLEEHVKARPQRCGRVTLVILNSVERACEVHRALLKAVAKDVSAPQIELIHSRYRGLDREQWAQRFLSRKHCEDQAANRIIVSTQVVEAGVDISATTLVTELAPWPSLIQRFGRTARYGGVANVTVVNREADEKGALPYRLADISAACEVLADLSDVGLAALQELEQALGRDNPELLKRLYPTFRTSGFGFLRISVPTDRVA